MEELESPESEFGKDVRIVAIWKGKDAAEFQRIQEGLESADIPFTVPDAKSSFQLVSTDPVREIWVLEGDQERARKVLLDLEGRVYPDELSPEEIESLALPESDAPDVDEPLDVEPDLSQDWDEDDPVAEVWKGDSEEFAGTLIVCLREIGIGSRKLSEEGQWRVVVRPQQETRAREIVREVVEASPPE
ncbi:MAG: hypothetical protein LAO19_20575 [Acidobacteriia bacterium]|nr:hypothetical protein [Terriglobia bacterium]